jgi:hypothetical protein
MKELKRLLFFVFFLVQGACIHKLQYNKYDMVSTWSSLIPMNKTSN